MIYKVNMEELVKNLKKSGVLRTPQIIEAFLKVDRKDFVPESLKDAAYFDEALPIGRGQTISQPYTVAFMFELLYGGPSTYFDGAQHKSLRASKIMDVGYGSGWSTALLAEIVGEEGKVYAFERVEELCNFGEENLIKYPELHRRVLLFCKDASGGVPGEEFDAIIAAAELKEIPASWREQLKIGGRLVYPKEQTIFKEVKKGENARLPSGQAFSVQKYPGFVFVPFVRD